MITFYSTGCPRCKMLKQRLDSENIPYTVVNDIQAMKDRGIQTVPVLEVAGKLYNFSEAITSLPQIKSIVEGIV